MLKPLRHVSNSNSVYLTFDDGPDPQWTPKLLDSLAKYQVRATFFVIGKKAKMQPELIARMIREGHTIGDHSWDHAYRQFFRSRTKTREWIRQSQFELKQMIGQTPVGFRSPAGVQTPKLNAVLDEMGIPLILWSRRYFDTVFGFNANRAGKAAEKVKSGDIILLHDRSCEGLEQFVSKLKARGMVFSSLRG